jgi:hypothetical protein
MKKIRILLMIMSLSAVSCVEKITVDSKNQDTKLIVNAQMSASEKKHTIFIGSGEGYSVGAYNGASVTCTINGEKRIKATLKENEDSYSQNVLSEYVLNTEFQPGDSVRLDIGSKYGDVYSAVRVPETSAEITGIDTTSKGYLFHLTVHIEEEEPAGLNYYRIRLRHRYEATGYDDSGAVVKRGSGSNFVSLDNDNDPILNGGQLGEDQLIDKAPNVYCVFNNRFFQDGKATIEVTARTESLYQLKVGGNADHWAVKNKAELSLLSISKEEYNYLSYLNSLQAADDDFSYFFEPMVLPNNVEGGLGFVSIASERTFSFQLEDKVY